MNDLRKIIVLQEALRIACQFIRENPACDIDPYIDLFGSMGISVLADGLNRDPKGEEFQSLFIKKAIDKLGFIE